MQESDAQKSDVRRNDIQIDGGSADDIESLLAIYNYEVEHGVATLDLNPKTLEEWQAWYAAHNVDNHPLLVARVAGQVAGYATLSSYREKEAYRSTVELSVYIDVKYRRRGVATALMEAALLLAREDERTHTVVSVITAGNEASVKLHEKFGFVYCGRIREVGMKFGKYLDIDNYSLNVSK
ncbi:MAG: GNAT family N-acetyltransferase [Candidatus Gastranaerophilales bacterium]|nr:GNAT family N-acetyltransferase [Candidatus Gastranaerophilales bacterium]